MRNMRGNYGTQVAIIEGRIQGKEARVDYDTNVRKQMSPENHECEMVRRSQQHYV